MTLPLFGPMSLTDFAHPWFFLLLLGVAALAGYYVFVQFARRKRILRFANMELLESVAPKRPNRWRYPPAILLLCSLVMLTVAMAGPRNEVRVPRNRAVVMLVIDVSQSMRATDVEPSRLAAAEEAAKQFADQLTPALTSASSRTPEPRPSWCRRRPIGSRPRSRWASCSWPTAPPPVRRSSPHCRPSPPSGQSSAGRRRPGPAWAHRADVRRQETVPSNPTTPRVPSRLHGPPRTRASRFPRSRSARPTGTWRSTTSVSRCPWTRKPKKIAELSDGNHYSAENLEQLKQVFTQVQDQIGYETVKGDASVGWLRLGRCCWRWLRGRSGDQPPTPWLISRPNRHLGGTDRVRRAATSISTARKAREPDFGVAAVRH